VLRISSRCRGRAGSRQKVESNEPAKRDYLAALDQYSCASDAFDRARTPAELAPIARHLEEGRYPPASAITPRV
jgi:hypothetical protein